MAEAVKVTRLVYPGAPVSGVATVKSAKIVKAPDNANIYTVRVPNIAHYESGCRDHAGCWGHFCVTDSGIMLPPQSLSMRVGDIATEYLKSSRLAFEGRRTDYIKGLEKTNFTKDGTMRCIMSTPIAGSARLIATPMWRRRDVVWISPNLAAKLKTCYVDVDDNGVSDHVYKERSLSEGDHVILVRPPPLNIWNTQPMKVAFWDHDCIGVHPETFSMFHGDYDGDEAHIIPVYHPLSIRECESWTVPSSTTFSSTRERYLRDNPDTVADDDYYHRCAFINTTTVSSSEMKNEVLKLAYGNASRMKDSSMVDMHRRFNDRNTELDFVAQSIRGTRDVCRQQLSQGLIGDMTRVAKMAAMCFVRHREGGLYVLSRNGPVLLCNDGITDPGVPCVRAVMSVCEVAQQAALDSHRVQESNMASHDIVSDLFIGRPVLEPCGKRLPTIVVLEERTTKEQVSYFKPLWKFSTDGYIVLLCNPVRVPAGLKQLVAGSYNPVILSSVSDSDSRAQVLCYRGLSVVCNYYGLKLTPTELKDMSYLMSFKVRESSEHITTRTGLLERGLQWIETLEGTDITCIDRLVGHWGYPLSSTSSMFLGNFTGLAIGDVTRTHSSF
ncbi:MAG: hypothetical protein FE78DRAFT_66951 [Acidomyces sp. 'richmondensis']|nr:MAG: hypothetical protein FE78DRAFT_66951 [Acidomyces sp. 'richmondensis']